MNSPEGPATFEYCDVVMKGGITSGVVYPLAIEELSKKYFFKNIGGTSAGAVAAAVTAAAEFGRRTNNPNAYSLLASIPKQLGANNLLLNLFQPSDASVRAFRVVLAALKMKSVPGRILQVIASLIYQFWGWVILGLLLGATIPALLYFICGGPIPTYVVLGLFWVIVTGGFVVLGAAVVDAIKATTANGFGLCSGFDQNSQSGPPLTNWLHEQIQSAAGKPLNSPLTFGDLWKAPLMPQEVAVTDNVINLQVVTTNLTLGCPATIPFQRYAYYFDQNEFRKLFPDSVVQHLIANSPKPKRLEETITSRNGTQLYRLPEGQDLPIVVAARMSLSFPILLSAVPLYFPNHAQKLVSDDPATDGVGARGTGTEPKEQVRVNADRCWFSDGGICSNFPMFFFDSPLPRWPTFGIDLEPRRCPTPKPSNREMVWFPPGPGAGARPSLDDFDQGTDWQRLVGFFGAIANTMQNWRDKLQALAAGYRDRIVHIKLCPDEGGLNLNMPPAIISNLSERGQIAGQTLCQQFKFDEHIYVRYRITMSAMQTYLNTLTTSWTEPLPQATKGYEYVSRNEPPHYKPRSPNLADVMFHGLKDLIHLVRGWKRDLKPDQSFGKDRAPMPEPVLRNQPKF